MQNPTSHRLLPDGPCVLRCRSAKPLTQAPSAARMDLSAATEGSMPPRVLVYNGEGAGPRCALSAKQALEGALHGLGAEVSFIGTEQLLSGEWTRADGGCDLFCMPGGADLPYCRRLNGRGNQVIRSWVETGGAYLGLCAGAYYASSRCIFEPGSRMEVVGDRELALFPGHATGAVYPGFGYMSEQGAAAAPIMFRPIDSLAHRQHKRVTMKQLWRSSSSGKSSSATACTATATPITVTEPATEAAVHDKEIERSSLAVPHSTGQLPGQARLGGTAVSVPTSTGQGSTGKDGTAGQQVTSSLTQQVPHSSSSIQGAKVDLATANDYTTSTGQMHMPPRPEPPLPSLPPISEAAAAVLLSAPEPLKAPTAGSSCVTSWACHLKGWSCCSDYSNGGPMLLNHEGNKDLGCYGDHVEVLAMYTGPGQREQGAAAAVRCKVGKGVAVLCGTHPELHHDWLYAYCKEQAALQAAGFWSPAESSTVVQMCAHVQRLAVQLEQEAAGRSAFWQLLLHACLD